MNIIRPSASMRKDISNTSPLETECLFGETVEILEEHLDWFYCRLIADNYHGWIKKNNLGKLTKITHRVIDIRTFIYKEKNPKSEALLYLSMGSKLAIESIEFGWGKTSFFINDKMHSGYVPSNHIVSTNHKVLDWVEMAQKFEGIPYRWGGRDSIGIDCSALLQLSYETYGQIIPRNTSKQVCLKKPRIDSIDDLKRGCVIFWEGHVAIMIDKLNCIHANAFHMKTKVEPLIDVINRICKKHDIVKIMDFN